MECFQPPPASSAPGRALLQENGKDDDDEDGGGFLTLSSPQAMITKNERGSQSQAYINNNCVL